MRKPIVVLLAIVVAVAGLLTYFAFDSAESQADSPANIASAIGIAEIQGQDVFVEVLVLVAEGRSAEAATAAALAAQGARPFALDDIESQEFTFTGLFWESLPVVQYYNDSNEPAGIDGETALQNTQNMWNSVATSAFDSTYAGATSRCPSLVDECPGPQSFDTYNDVAFLALKPCNIAFGCTIGVTWSGVNIDEADMAITTKVAWNDTCSDVSGTLEVQTVIGHEEGHVVGLGHSSDPLALMHTPYSGAQCSLGADDIAGVSALYPGGPPTDTPTTTDTPTNTPTPTTTNTPGGPTPVPPATATSTATPSSTSVIVDDISYSTNGGRAGDKHLNITISLVDGDGLAVGGASVSIDLNLDGEPYASGTGSTDVSGTVTFTANNAPSGCYDTEVTDVTAAGLNWDGIYPANSVEKGGSC